MFPFWDDEAVNENIMPAWRRAAAAKSAAIREARAAKRQIVITMLRNGIVYSEISQATHLSIGKISVIAREEGLGRNRPRGAAQQELQAKREARAAKRRGIADAIARGLNHTDISNAFGVSLRTVTLIAHAEGLTRNQMAAADKAEPDPRQASLF